MTNVLFSKVLPLSEMDNKTKDLGYSVIHKDDCIYKVEARDKAGKQWELSFDPVTGKLIGKELENDND